MSKNWNTKASEVSAEEFAMIEAEERLVYEAQKAVRALMRERDRSSADLADALGVSPARISQMMSGRANLTLRTIAKIYHVLGTRAALSEAGTQAAKATQPPVTERAEAIVPTLERSHPAAYVWEGIEPRHDAVLASALEADEGYGTRVVWIESSQVIPTIAFPPLAPQKRRNASATLAKLPPYQSAQRALINA